ncbi:unnamed protein product [Oppiella nova]|uniref:Nuclear receptor domain-containing protein n=1 Tax=Oppiella nova TaxID=334625 RepID=A0A7R9QKE0_9ACAR|nr:unnamed protein product [Oppiella nova]CAG2167707.1 unnamed protein product [Oppiella nova]
MSQKKVQLKCDICGDNAVGRNFGAITCESCKVFFRRANLKNRELIQRTGPKKRGKVANNKKKVLNTDNTVDDTSVDTNTGGILEYFRDNTVLDNIFDSNDEIHVNQIISTFENNMTDNESETMFESEVQLSLKPVFKQITDYKSFNDLESKRLSELFNACNVFTYKSFCTINRIEITDILELYRAWGDKMDQDMVDLVKFTKTLSTFGDICLNDQLALIKYGCLEYEKRNMYTVYKAYINKIIPQWNQDFIILDLLTAILLFNPNRPNLMHNEVIKAEQQLYIYLLQRYLIQQNRYEWESQSKLQQLMNILMDLQIISDIEKQNGIPNYLIDIGVRYGITDRTSDQIRSYVLVSAHFEKIRPNLNHQSGSHRGCGDNRQTDPMVRSSGCVHSLETGIIPAE